MNDGLLICLFLFGIVRVFVAIARRCASGMGLDRLARPESERVDVGVWVDLKEKLLGSQ